MTQDEKWMARYNDVVTFIETISGIPRSMMLRKEANIIRG